MLNAFGRPVTAASGRCRRSSRVGVRVAAAVGFALFLAACGSNGPTVAQLGAGATTGTTNDSPQRSVAAGLAGSGPPAGGVPHAESSIGIAGLTGAGGLKSALKFSVCVRSHGVPSFPDPNADGTFHFQGGPSSTPGLQTAMRTCMSLLHLGGPPPSPATQAKQLASLVKFSACMRSHGVPKFPDPTTSPGGGVGLTLTAGSGIDPSSPSFVAAQNACRTLQPGPPGGP